MFFRRRGRGPRIDDSSERELALRHLQDRIHLLEAVQAGLDRREEVLPLVTQAADQDEARAAVQGLLGLDVEGAEAVLGMQWRRLTVSARCRVYDELEECHLEHRQLQD